MDSALSREFAERFRELYDAEGAETIDAEGSQAMVNLGAMLYRVVGPDRFLQVVDMVLHSVERDVPTILRRWAYQIIPADDAEPIRTGVAMMSDTSDYYELRQIVEPHLGRFPTPNRILGELINLREVDGSERDMFAEEPYGHDAKGLPRNRRATKLLLRGETFKGFVAGTAVLFEERVVL